MTTAPIIDDACLVALMHDPDTTERQWAANAACISLADDTYFPDDDKTPPADALSRCAICPVAQHCLATALVHEAEGDHDDRFGWWGGHSPADREGLWARLVVPIARGPQDEVQGDPVAIAHHLRQQNQTIAAIATALNCSERTVYRYLAATAA